ncbi:hypothetical protein ROR02_02020 [Pararhodospirillum oryzae]|uniref:Uncharacterized protein n=1 Tax=Pararhodospirillum oryzae TaxID=478448 RepID=A0A512H3Q3_9PROT|nr:hypothetical protein ROR02_02020 [Pararhodospirillum oryzae]
MAAKALRTRSRLSATALSGSPTTVKAGNPLVIDTWTSTGTVSIPWKAVVAMRAIMGRTVPGSLFLPRLYATRLQAVTP